MVHAGEIVIVNPNSIHSLVAIEELHFYCLIINREFCAENFCDTNTVRFSPFLRDAELMGLVCRFAAFYQGEENAFRILSLRALLLELFALLCRRYGQTVEKPTEDSQLSGAIKQVIGYIHSESHRAITLEELSGLVGLSSSYLSRMFHRVTGYSIVTYINHTRCERAKQLLATQKLSVEAVAYECGYANVSYFIRTFRSITGCVPGKYRAQFLREDETGQNSKDL